MTLDTSKPAVAVLGPGGVGGLLAALLSRAGHRVICVAREETAHQLRGSGIAVRSSQFGDFTAAVEADTELREPVAACFVTVKQTTLDTALTRLPPAVLGDALLVPLLNGVEHPATLRARYRPDRVVAGVIRVESSRPAPAAGTHDGPVVIEHGSPFAEIDLASATSPPAEVESLASVLSSAGVTARVAEDENRILWAKLAFLAPFALLTTRYGAPLGEVRTRHHEELQALVAETTSVSRACGAPVDAAATLARYAAFPDEAKSSMQRDAEADRPLELDAIGGALLRAADRHAVPAPVTARLLRELRAAGH
ncbi:ketopantoate reductase family protein [Streptomyces sp. MS06]|uniref:ketopantoate reductase family protein n=1 Tax=Streptomyces sp. MS06 TaxID=3385974 RepID=UPI0039A1DEA2